MASQWSRRRFLQQSALAGAGVWLAAQDSGAQEPPRPEPPTKDKLNIGIIGVANRGADNLSGVRSQNIVALCDIDDNYLNAAAQQFPEAKTYSDFRLMLEQKGLDAVVVST